MSESSLEATDYIDINSPIIQNVVNRLTAHLSYDQEKACALFTFVRDEIKFGWCSYFSAMKASDVITAGFGYSHTKSTLFVALLRACNIPARQLFTDISSEILSGLGYTSGAYIDHSYCEVFLAGTWIKTDAYIVERPLFYKCRELLAQENKKIGYGVHALGVCEWDGSQDAFAQLVIDEDYFPKLCSRLWGSFRDSQGFYKEVTDAHDNYDVFFPLTIVMFAFFYFPNAKLEELRVQTNV